MKKFAIIILLLAVGHSYAQFRDSGTPKVDIHDAITTDQSSLMFGFFDPSKFNMNHTISMNYAAFSGHGVATTMYTNSMSYQFAPNFNVELDASVVHSPYNTLGDNFTNSINGIYLSRAQINYQPWENTRIMFQYRQLPATGYYGGYYSSPWGYGNRYYDPFRSGRTDDAFFE